MSTEHQPLPVNGYTPQKEDRVAAINEHKQMEEIILRRIEALPSILLSGVDHRWLAIARTHIEEGFMAMNRAVFRPERVKLPGDTP